MGEHYPIYLQIRDLETMIESDRRHMHEALEDGNYRSANRYREAIKASERDLRLLIRH